MNELEIKQKMDLLGTYLKQMEVEKEQFEIKTAKLNEKIEGLKFELKDELLGRKTSVLSEKLYAQYRKGAIRWDSAGLKRYSKAHPELLRFQTEGKPTVAFILRKEGDFLEGYENLREL